MNHRSAEEEWNNEQVECLRLANRNTQGEGRKAAYREAELLLEEINCPKDMRAIKRKFKEVVDGHKPDLPSSTGRKLRPAQGEAHPAQSTLRYILPQLTGQVRRDGPPVRETLVQTVERHDDCAPERRPSHGAGIDPNTTGLPSPRQTLGEDSTTASGGDELPLSHVSAGDGPASHHNQ